jgi:hypothetical protein
VNRFSYCKGKNFDMAISLKTARALGLDIRQPPPPCYVMLPNQKGREHMTKPQQRWWWFTKRTVIAFGLRFTNRAIIVFGLLLCVALAVGGAYLLGLLELVGLLH